MRQHCALLTTEAVVEPCRPGCKHYLYCLSRRLVGGDLRLLRRETHRCLQIPAGDRLVICGQACQHLYVIRSGWFKLTAGDEQGNEQVVGFRGPGELIGLVDLISGQHSHDIMALGDAEVLQIPAARALGILGHEAQSETLIAMAWRVGMERDRLCSRNKQNAISRVATFLLDLLDNQQLQSVKEPHLRLPMSRADIANFLGMKIETLSRCLSSLQQKSLVTAKGRYIEFENIELLRQLSDGDSPA